MPQVSALGPILFSCVLTKNIKLSIPLFEGSAILTCSSTSPDTLHNILSKDLNQLQL